MTSGEAAKRIQAKLGPLWPRDRPVPPALLAPLCEALWQERINPNRRIVQQRLHAVNDHALGPGVVAWRKTKGLPEQGIHSPHPLPTNLQELASIISSPIAHAPLTCFDPANDGRWKIPPPIVLRYLGRIENQSVRDAMALLAILRADSLPRSLYSQISNFTSILRRLMNEQRIEDVTAIDPDDLLFRVYAGDAGQGMIEDQLGTIISEWNTIRIAFEEYAARLSPGQREILSRFFIKPIADRRRLLRYKPHSTYRRQQRERVKRKTDALQPQFCRIRFVAATRCNQARRFYKAVKQAIGFVEANRLPYPHEFSYEETVQTVQGRPVRQRVELTLWDRIALWDHAVALGYRETIYTRMQRRWWQGGFSDENNRHYVEYNATKCLVKGVPPELFWFLNLFRHRVFRHMTARTDSDLAERRKAFSQ